jgi:hypothetical protein
MEMANGNRDCVGLLELVAGFCDLDGCPVEGVVEEGVGSADFTLNLPRNL